MLTKAVLIFIKITIKPVLLQNKYRQEMNSNAGFNYKIKTHL